MKAFDDANIMETTVDSKRVFDGLILHIDHITNRLPNGKLAAREVARHVGASAVVPVDAFKKLVKTPLDDIEMERFFEKLELVSNAHNCSFVLSISSPEDEVPEYIRKYTV